VRTDVYEAQVERGPHVLDSTVAVSGAPCSKRQLGDRMTIV
jgi:hypothetical protein